MEQYPLGPPIKRSVHLIKSKRLSQKGRIGTATNSSHGWRSTPNGFIKKWHIENPENHYLLISTSEKSYQYREDTNMVQVNTGPLIQGTPRVRSLFEDIQTGNCQVSSIQKGPATVLLCTFVDRDWTTIVEIDPITKLPISLQVNGPARPGTYLCQGN